LVVPSRLIVGPPGAGKTHRLLQVARDACRQGRRVTWLAPPHGRHAAYRRLAADGALLGLDVITPQQLLYRIVAAARVLRPTVTTTLRLALVAEALTALRGALPTPGEARLFARSIAEAKRHGLRPEDIAAIAERLDRGGAGDAAETRRLADVFGRYEAILAGRADYDDVRLAALDLARAGRAEVGADVLVVDGFREVGPLDLALYRHLATTSEVWLALTDAPPGWPPDERLTPRPSAVRGYRFANPVAEVRWVLRSLKRDLAAGVPQSDLALIAAPAARHALAALADEFGVPLSDEAPRALADTPSGRILLDLLELPVHPTAARLANVPHLADLSRAAQERRVAGRDAIDALATAVGLGGEWTALVAALTPAGDLEAWAARLVDRASAYAAAATASDARAAPEAADAEAPRESPSPEAVRDLLWTRGLEALRLGPHEGVRAWWAALVQETALPQRPRPGVPLLDAALASGRRFRKAYVVGAVAGAFTPAEHEDYFVPEDARLDPAELARVATSDAGGSLPGLPRRSRSLGSLVAAELLSRGDEVVVSAADADRGGPARLDPHLVREPVTPPEMPAGSLLEVLVDAPFRAAPGPALEGVPSVEELRRSDPCTLRVWAERLVPGGEAELPWGARARRALTADRRLDAERLANVAAAFPDLAAWLDAHRDRLLELSYGVHLPAAATVPRARVDALLRRGDVVEVVRFTTAAEDVTAPLDGRRRFNELYAARSLLKHPAVREVRLVAWPLLGEPVDLTPQGLTRAADGVRLDHAAAELDARWRRWREGPVVATPGHHCGRCRVRDVCREAPTS
jgi:ATP-dependent helicase/nuclease subunit B